MTEKKKRILTTEPRIVEDSEESVKKIKSSFATTSNDYLNLVGDLMYPKTVFSFGTFGPSKQFKMPVSNVTTLGYLTSPLRRPMVVEKWSPFEIAVFEGSIVLFGKNFHEIQKHVKTKTVKEIIEFYYFWKKTDHYKQWKKTYIPDERDTPTVLVEN